MDRLQEVLVRMLALSLKCPAHQLALELAAMLAPEHQHKLLHNPQNKQRRDRETLLVKVQVPERPTGSEMLICLPRSTILMEW